MKRGDVLGVIVAGIGVAAALLPLLQPALALASGYLFATALAIAIIDARHFIIPDRLLLPAIPAGFAARLLAGSDVIAVLEDCTLGALLGGGSFYLIRWLYRVLRKREGLGLGDVKLAAVSGIWLGAEDLPLWVLIAAASALLTVAIRHLLPRKERRFTATTAIPFGTFLAPSLWIVWMLSALALPFWLPIR